MRALVRRFARTHGPFPTARLAARYGVDPAPALRELEREGALVRGELLPGGTEREWCDAEALRRVRRASLARLRREVEAADRSQLARFLPSWQNVDAHRSLRRRPRPPARGTRRPSGRRADPQGLGGRRAGRVGSAPTRPPGSMSSAPAARWFGLAPARWGAATAASPSTSARMSASPGPPPANAKLERPEGEVHDAIRERLAAGPDFWLDLLADLDFGAEELHTALWDLAWSGEVTNDAFSPLRAPRLRAVAAPERQGRRFARRRSSAGAAVQGRWSLTAPLFTGAPAIGPRLRAQAELMLERYGIVTRETVLAEGVPGGFSTLYAELGNLELLGTARRGYFVEGLGGAQFALPGAVERLRSLPDAHGRAPAARRHRSRQPLRRLPPLAEAGGRPPSGPRPRRPPAAPRRRADRLRRARRPRHPPPRRARRGGAGGGAARPRGRRLRRPAAQARHREARRRAGDRFRI